MAALTAKQIKAIGTAHAAGKSTRQIAAEIGCSRSTVSNRVRALGLDSRAVLTVAAVEASRADGRAHLAVQAGRMRTAVDRILDRIEASPIPEPHNPRGFLELAQAASVLLDAQHNIARNNPEDGVDEARDVAKAIERGLRRLFPDPSA